VYVQRGKCQTIRFFLKSHLFFFKFYFSASPHREWTLKKVKMGNEGGATWFGLLSSACVNGKGLSYKNRIEGKKLIKFNFLLDLVPYVTHMRRV